MMKLGRNAFKANLAEGRLQIGFWCSLCSPIAAEILADSGVQWLLLDGEHAPNDHASLLAQLQAIGDGGPATPIVRPAWNDPTRIKPILDMGAQTLLIPFVQSASEAEVAVAATRYPPAGIRGVTGSGRASRYGRGKAYLHTAHEEICVIVQLETPEALAELEAIAATPGVDAVFVGPSDLSAAMGHIGEPQHPEVQAAIADAASRLQEVGKPAGILAGTAEEARRYADLGYRFIAVGSDVGMLVKGSDAIVDGLSIGR